MTNFHLSFLSFQGLRFSLGHLRHHISGFHDHTAETSTQAQTISDPNQRYRALRTAFAVLATDQPEIAQSLLASASASLDRQHTERLQEMLRAVSLTP